MPAHPGELAGLQALAAESGPGDVLALMAPAERPEILAWLGRQGPPCSTPSSSGPGLAARAGSLAATHRHRDPEVPVLEEGVRQLAKGATSPR